MQSRNVPAGNPSGDPSTDCAPDTVSRQTFVPALWVRTCLPDVQDHQRKDPPPPTNVAVNPSTETVTVSPVRECASTVARSSTGIKSPSIQATGMEIVGAVPVQSVVRGSAPCPARAANTVNPKTIERFININCPPC